MKIKDKLIDPYEIHFDGIQYTVGKPRVDKEGREYLSGASYYTKINYAIFKIISMQIGDKKDVVTLKEFYKQFKELSEKVENRIKL